MIYISKDLFVIYSYSYLFISYGFLSIFTFISISTFIAVYLFV